MAVPVDVGYLFAIARDHIFKGTPHLSWLLLAVAMCIAENKRKMKRLYHRPHLRASVKLNAPTPHRTQRPWASGR